MRKRQAVKRDVLPDPIYKSKVVTKLINQIMNDGKKGTAQKILYGAFDMIKEKTGEEPMAVFEKAMNNIKPSLEVKSRRVGGANYQVPVEVKPARAGLILAIAFSNTTIASSPVFSLTISKASYMILCAVPFLPSCMMWLTNLVTTFEL